MENRKDEIRKELKELAPGLPDLSRMEGFEVPHNYFKHLPERIMERIEAEQEEVPVSWFDGLTVWFEKLFQPKYALILASIAVLIVAGTLLMRPDREAFPLLVDLTPEEAFEFAIENIEDFDEELLGSIALPEDFEVEAIGQPTPEEMDDVMDALMKELGDQDIEDLL